MWYRNSAWFRLRDYSEYSQISRDLTVHADSYEASSDPSFPGLFQDNFFISTGEKDYILNLEFKLNSLREGVTSPLRIKITSTNKKTVEDEMQRARALVDNIIRVQRRRLEQEATA